MDKPKKPKKQIGKRPPRCPAADDLLMKEPLIRLRDLHQTLTIRISMKTVGNWTFSSRPNHLHYIQVGGLIFTSVEEYRRFMRRTCLQQGCNCYAGAHPEDERVHRHLDPRSS
jgi:hypothetical protein